MFVYEVLHDFSHNVIRSADKRHVNVLLWTFNRRKKIRIENAHFMIQLLQQEGLSFTHSAISNHVYSHCSSFLHVFQESMRLYRAIRTGQPFLPLFSNFAE